MQAADVGTLQGVCGHVASKGALRHLGTLGRIEAALQATPIIRRREGVAARDSALRHRSVLASAGRAPRALRAGILRTH